MIEIIMYICLLLAIIASVYVGLIVALKSFEMVKQKLFGMLIAIIVFSIVSGIVRTLLFMIISMVFKMLGVES